MGEPWSTSSKNLLKRNQILWIGKSGLQKIEDLKRDPFFGHWTWILLDSIPSGPVDPTVGIFIVEASLDPDFSFLSRVAQAEPSTIRICLQDVDGLTTIRRAVNRGRVFRILPWVREQGRLHEVIRQAVIESEVLEGNLRLLKESSHQNRELEKLNSSLERIVEERTHHIQISKEIQDEKVSRVRGLTRFVQELSGRSSFEEVLELLRRDLKIFHQVQGPLLLYEIDSSGPHLVSSRSNRVQTNRWPFALDLVRHIHLNDPELSKKMANVLSRPFAKALVIPIELSAALETTLMTSVHVILENSLAESEVSDVLDFCIERMQPLATALERIRLEQELIHFSYRWEKTFDGLKDPIAIIDRSDRVLRANRKFAERTHSQRCFELFANETTRCEGCPVPLVLQTGQAQKGQIRKKGRIFDVHSYPVSLVPGGKPTNVVNQYVDQTQSRELYMRLLQAEKMGALGLLAGNIAHELNNPLTGIRALAQVLGRDQVPGSQLAQDIGEIERAAERSQMIIRNLLEFVQQRESALVAVNVDDLVEKTLPFLKTSMRMIRLSKSLATGGTFVLAEAQMLQQVIFNLIHNACQALGLKGNLILKSEVQGNEVFFWVTDNGPGIPSEILTRIFEPFFTTKAEGSGTGLGLSLSKEVIERFGGRIGVESKLGEGASFWFALPKIAEAHENSCN